MKTLFVPLAYSATLHPSWKWVVTGGDDLKLYKLDYEEKKEVGELGVGGEMERTARSEEGVGKGMFERRRRREKEGCVGRREGCVGTWKEGWRENEA